MRERDKHLTISHMVRHFDASAVVDFCKHEQFLPLVCRMWESTAFLDHLEPKAEGELF